MNSFVIPRTGSDWFIFLIRLVVGGFFIYASIDKIINPDAFAKSIHNYRMLQPVFINIMAIFMPWLEFIAGVCLITGIRYRGANILIMGMLVVFIIALGSAYNRGLNINCGCFSTSDTAKSNLVMRLVEDVLMLIGCFIIMFKDRIFRRQTSTSVETAMQ